MSPCACPVCHCSRWRCSSSPTWLWGALQEVVVPCLVSSAHLKYPRGSRTSLWLSWHCWKELCVDLSTHKNSSVILGANHTCEVLPLLVRQMFPDMKISPLCYSIKEYCTVWYTEYLQKLLHLNTKYSYFLHSLPWIWSFWPVRVLWELCDAKWWCTWNFNFSRDSFLLSL